MKAATSKQTKHFYSFGPFRLYRDERELFRGEEPVGLSPKAVDALLLLTSRRGHVVSKDDFMAALWPNAFVEEANLANKISELRRALGDREDGGPYIETVARRGYRFAGTLTDSWEGRSAEFQGEGNTLRQLDLIRKVRFLWGLLAATALALVLVSIAYFRQTPTDVPRAPLRTFSLTPPSPLQVSDFDHLNVAISPNGKYIAFVAREDRRLWIHELELGASRPLEGTEGADGPFWSPGSDFIGYLSGAQIRTISVQGGAPIRVYQSPGRTEDFGGIDLLHGGSWSPDGKSIVFAEEPGLYEVPARGGTAELVVSSEDVAQSLELPEGRKGLMSFPHFLPPEAGPRVLVYTFSSSGQRSLIVHDLESSRREVLGPGEIPSYSPSGHLLFHSGIGTFDLWALPFSLEKLRATGPAFPIAQRARLPTIASDQTLVYLDLAGLEEEWQLVLWDRAGNDLRRLGEAHTGSIFHIALSPNGRKVAVAVDRDIWIHEVDRPVRTRLTAYEGIDWQPRWSPKGDRIAFSSARSGARDVYVMSADGSDEPKLIFESPDSREDPNDWSEDESVLVLSRYPEREIFYLRRQEAGDGYEEVPFLENATEGRLSPDGRYLAYETAQSGRSEIYVRSFPDGEDRQRVSVNGGRHIRWRRDGKELFYVEGETLMGVPISTSSGLTIGLPLRLFSVDPSVSGQPGYDVAADGQRFVVPERVKQIGEERIRVVLNWYEEFRHPAE